MSKHYPLGARILKKISSTYTVHRLDLGGDARLSRKGIQFATEAYQVEGVGHLCIMRMKAMFGLMRMETVVLAPVERDLPLFNLDWVSAFGKETQMAELYDTQLKPAAPDMLSAMERIKEGDRDLPDPPSGGDHWYDDILYPCSYHKVGKGISKRLAKAAAGYARIYLKELQRTPVCDRGEKTEKVRAFAETLFDQGGPAVDQVTKLFGRETARRLIVQHMYGLV